MMKAGEVIAVNKLIEDGSAFGLYPIPPPEDPWYNHHAPVAIVRFYTSSDVAYFYSHLDGGKHNRIGKSQKWDVEELIDFKGFVIHTHRDDSICEGDSVWYDTMPYTER